MKVSRSINDENIDFYKKIGQEIVNYRKLKGISQERLAAVLGVSFQQMQKYEKAVNRLPLDKFFKINEFLEMHYFGSQEGQFTPRELEIICAYRKKDYHHLLELVI